MAIERIYHVLTVPIGPRPAPPRGANRRVGHHRPYGRAHGLRWAPQPRNRSATEQLARAATQGGAARLSWSPTQVSPVRFGAVLKTKPRRLACCLGANELRGIFEHSVHEPEALLTGIAWDALTAPKRTSGSGSSNACSTTTVAGAGYAASRSVRSQLGHLEATDGDTLRAVFEGGVRDR